MNGTSRSSRAHLAVIAIVSMTFAPVTLRPMENIGTTSKQVREDRAASIVLAQGRCVWNGQRWICF